MPPRSTVGIVAPSSDNTFQKDVDEWLNDKRRTDGAEGLWRIHDGLYDFSSFVDSHPGGKFWLQDTKGTDITEAFEVHHISTSPEAMMKKFFIRNALTPRSSPFTFHEHGFYKTLKRRVRDVLKTIPQDGVKASKHYSDGLVAATFFFSVLANLYWSYLLTVVSGVFFALTVVAAHNHSHQRDNFRMYYADLCLTETRETRIIHILSHHMLTNTIADIQIFFPYPWLNFFPERKSLLVRYGNFVFQPLVYWPLMLPLDSITKAYRILTFWRRKIQPMHFLPFALPITMYLLGSRSIFSTIFTWELITLIGSFVLGVIGFTGTHFHPEVFIDGDTARNEDRDWGVFQLDSVSDRYEIAGNHFLVLVTFGDHALHHLFPTLDHGLLGHLYPVVEETAKEFDLNIRMKTSLDMFAGYFRRVAKDRPNPNPPSAKNNKFIVT